MTAGFYFFGAAGETVLPPGFVHHDGNGVGEVEAAVVGAHGQVQALRRRKAFSEALRQPFCFRAKNKEVAGLECGTGKAGAAFRGQGKYSVFVGLVFVEKVVPVPVNFDGGKFVVVQPGPAHFGVVKGKSQGFDQMELCAGVGAKADDVAGIGRDFRFDQDNVEYGFPCLKRGSGENKSADGSCACLFEQAGDFSHGLAGGQHIVNDGNVAAWQAG